MMYVTTLYQTCNPCLHICRSRCVDPEPIHLPGITSCSTLAEAFQRWPSQWWKKTCLMTLQKLLCCLYMYIYIYIYTYIYIYVLIVFMGYDSKFQQLVPFDNFKLWNMSCQRHFFTYQYWHAT